jgi:hypothetical protein
MRASELHPSAEDRHNAASVSPDSVTARSRSAGWIARLRRHLVLVIAAKLVLLALLYALFFSPAQRPDIDAGGVADRFFAPR